MTSLECSVDYWRSQGFDVPDARPGYKIKLITSPLSGRVIGVTIIPRPPAPVEWHGDASRRYELAPVTPWWVWGSLIASAAIAWAWAVWG